MSIDVQRGAEDALAHAQEVLLRAFQRPLKEVQLLRRL